MILTARSTRLRLPVAIASIALLAACAGNRDADDVDTSVVGGDVAAPRIDSAAPSTTAADSLSVPADDAGMMAVEKTIDDAEVDAARLAIEKAQNADVKKYAQDMIDAHSKDKREVEQLEKSANVTATMMPSGGILATLHASHEKTMNELRTVTGAEFDRQYVKAQVTAHTQALDVLRRMESAAQNAQVKAHLAKVIPVVQGHLDRATQLERTIG
jgi:putative membrane protein